MRKAITAVIILVTIALSFTAFIDSASADELKMVGTISKIEMAADGKSAVVTLKDNKTDAAVAIIIADELTLDKFKDKRIVEGDEIRTKYETDGGKNTSKMFKKTAGC